MPRATDPPSQGAPRHGGRFQNHDASVRPRGLGEVMKWRFEAIRAGLPRPPLAPTPRLEPDLDFLHANAIAAASMIPALTWIGHASSLLQVGGLNLLLDPIFSDRASPLSFAGPKRQTAPGLRVADLPRIDVVLISHNHYDHLDDASIRALLRQAGGAPRFIAPLGVQAWLAKRGIDDAVELDWWQSTRIGDVEIVFTPSQHWSSRGLGDRMQTLWGGYAIFAPDFQVLFAGDTAYSADFADIHRRFAARHGGDGRGFDLALVPIGAYEPRWFMREQHCDPAEAVQIHLDVHAERSVGIHWGTFELTDESLDEPPRALEVARQDRGIGAEAFSVMAVGETRRYPRRKA